MKKKNPKPAFHFKPLGEDLPDLPEGVHAIGFMDPIQKWYFRDGRRMADSIELPDHVRKDFAGFWIRDGQIAWLTDYQLLWARGLLPGSEPWRSRPDTDNLLDFLFGACETVEAEPVVPGLINQREVFFLVGQKKTRKTTTLIDLGVALSVAGEWLKWRIPREFRVLFLDAEMTREEIDKILAESCARRGASLTDVESRLVTVPFKERGGRVTAKDVFRVSYHLASHRPDVLIVDNWRSFLPVGFDESSQDQAIEVMEVWKAIARNMGPKVPIIMAAHAKAEMRRGDPLAAIAGHNSIGGMVSGGLAIFNDSERTWTMEYQCRSVPPGPGFPVEVRPGERFFSLAGSGRGEGSTVNRGGRAAVNRDQAVADDDVGVDVEVPHPLADAITMALQENDGAQSVNFLKGLVQGRTQDIYRTVNFMVSHGMILRGEDGKLSLPPPT